jgi:DNA-binding CsgD family transcriptional regulator
VDTGKPRRDDSLHESLLQLVLRSRLLWIVSFLTHLLSAPEHAALLAAEREGGPFLAHRDAHGDLRVFPLTTVDRVRIGRTAGNDVVLAGDAQVSRAHALLEAAGAGWTVVDDGMSRNGTYVNGERVMRHRRLEDRDVLRIGATSILFRFPTMVVDDSTQRATAIPEARVTEAERRVLVALCRPLLRPGLIATTPASNQEIADALSLSLPGVKSHVRSLFAKVGVDDLPQNRKRAELARRALEFGLVSARDL